MRAATTLLLDLDGTLSDNFPGIAGCIRHALQRLGAAEPPDADLTTCVGPPLRVSFARLLATDDAGRIEAAIGFYRERYREEGWRENTVYEGVPAMLATLASRGHRMLVCTSKPEVFASRIVAHFGFDRYVERVYGADLAGTLDDKRALLAHLVATEALDPATCVMIGDREHDVRAAKSNAMRCVGVLWGYGSTQELAAADAWAPSPPALPDTVDALR